MYNRFTRLRDKVEKMVFAGLKPDAPPPVVTKSKLESLMESAEDLASHGLQPADKPLPGPMSARRKAGIAFACLAAGGLVYFLVIVLQRPAEQGEGRSAAPPPVPILAPGVKIEKNKDLEVVAMEFHKNAEPMSITGTLRNRTGQTFARCEVSFDVHTAGGEQLGGASTVISNLGPHADAQFRIAVRQKGAEFVMVRELRTD